MTPWHPLSRDFGVTYRRAFIRGLAVPCGLKTIDIDGFPYRLTSAVPVAPALRAPPMADLPRRAHGSDPRYPRRPAASRAAETRQRNRVLRLKRIRTRTAREDNAVGVFPSLLVRVALPHREVYVLGPDGKPLTVATSRLAPDGQPEREKILASHYQAVNGDLTLTVRAGLHPGRTAGLPPLSRGVPFGGLARLLLAHIVTEARKRESQDVNLGCTLSTFCERVAITPSGGEHGRIGYVTDQLTRLVTCSISYEWAERRGYGAAPLERHLRGENLFIANRYHIWHRDATPSSEPITSGTLRLADDFWRDVLRQCIPFDFRKAHFLRAHPTALDLYFWLTHRLYKLADAAETEVALSLDQLHDQLGSHYATGPEGALTPEGKREFGRAVRKALDAIRVIWPALRVETPRGRIVLYATGPDVPRAE